MVPGVSSFVWDFPTSFLLLDPDFQYQSISGHWPLGACVTLETGKVTLVGACVLDPTWPTVSHTCLCEMSPSRFCPMVLGFQSLASLLPSRIGLRDRQVGLQGHHGSREEGQPEEIAWCHSKWTLHGWARLAPASDPHAGWAADTDFPSKSCVGSIPRQESVTRRESVFPRGDVLVYAIILAQTFCALFQKLLSNFKWEKVWVLSGRIPKKGFSLFWQSGRPSLHPLPQPHAAPRGLRERRAFPVSSHSFPDSAGGVGTVITKALAG